MCFAGSDSVMKEHAMRYTAWLVAALALASATIDAQRQTPPSARVDRSSGSYATVSPSVVASSSTWRDATGVVSVDILILWRGSPGWMYRRTGSGSSSGGGPNRDGTVDFSIYQGGLHLTAKFDPVAHTADVLGERVDLKNANVVFVDRVDSPDGPVVIKTTTAPSARGQSPDVSPVLRNTPELLDYLRCEQQIPGGLSHPSMGPVCADAVLKGAVKAATVMNEVPTGPIANRAAGVAPPPLHEVPPPGATSSGSGVMSASVAAGWFLHAEGAGAVSLDLLVLWRGSPGWPMQATSRGGSGGGMGSRRGMNVRYGEISLYAAYDIGPRRYTIENDTKALGEDNVVLVDDVDSATGPRVLKTLRVDPAVPPDGRVDQLVARSPELVAYLRCDAKLADARKQMAAEILCARYGK